MVKDSRENCYFDPSFDYCSELLLQAFKLLLLSSSKTSNLTSLLNTLNTTTAIVDWGEASKYIMHFLKQMIMEKVSIFVSSPSQEPSVHRWSSKLVPSSQFYRFFFLFKLEA